MASSAASVDELVVGIPCYAPSTCSDGICVGMDVHWGFLRGFSSGSSHVKEFVFRVKAGPEHHWEFCMNPCKREI